MAQYGHRRDEGHGLGRGPCPALRDGPTRNPWLLPPHGWTRCASRPAGLGRRPGSSFGRAALRRLPLRRLPLRRLPLRRLPLRPSRGRAPARGRGRVELGGCRRRIDRHRSRAHQGRHGSGGAGSNVAGSNVADSRVATSGHVGLGQGLSPIGGIGERAGVGQDVRVGHAVRVGRVRNAFRVGHLGKVSRADIPDQGVVDGRAPPFRYPVRLRHRRSASADEPGVADLLNSMARRWSASWRDGS